MILILVGLVILFGFCMIWWATHRDPIKEKVIGEDLFYSIKQIHCNYEKVLLTGLGEVEGRTYTLHKCEELIIRNCTMNFIMNINKYFNCKKFIKKLVIERPCYTFEGSNPNTLKLVGEIVFLNVNEKDANLIRKSIDSNKVSFWSDAEN